MHSQAGQHLNKLLLMLSWETPKRVSQSMGLCDPGACTAAEEALKKEAVESMNLKMRNKPMRNEPI